MPLELELELEVEVEVEVEMAKSFAIRNLSPKQPTSHRTHDSQTLSLRLQVESLRTTLSSHTGATYRKLDTPPTRQK